LFFWFFVLWSGSFFNKSDLVCDTGISVKVAGDWISVLEASGIVVLLEPWFENLGKRVVKTPKVYVQEPGLLCFLLGLDEESVSESPLRGAIWESFVFAELRKVNATSASPGRFWYYRDQAGREVDFLLERGGRLDLIEAKWSEHPAQQEGEGMKVVSTALERHSQSSRPGARWIVCRCDNPFSLADGTRAIDPLDLEVVFARR
jgi:uncharacterized protein